MHRSVHVGEIWANLQAAFLSVSRNSTRTPGTALHGWLVEFGHLWG